MVNKIKKIIKEIENKDISFKTLLSCLFGIVLLRFFVEIFLLNFPHKSDYNYLFFLLNDFLVVISLYLTFLIFLFLFINKETKKISNVLLYGIWLILIPVVIDKMVFGDNSF